MTQTNVAQYYDDRIIQHGPTHKAVDASSDEALLARYKVLSEVCDLSNKSVLEVGCGYGAFGNYLKTNYPSINYTGVDISELMIEAGQELYSNLNLLHADVMQLGTVFNEGYDVVLCQGLFYLLDDFEQVKALIAKMFSLTRDCLAFTSVCQWPYGPSDDELRIDPVATLEYCQTLTQNVHLRYGYWPGDICFYLYRN